MFCVFWTSGQMIFLFRPYTSHYRKFRVFVKQDVDSSFNSSLQSNFFPIVRKTRLDNLSQQMALLPLCVYEELLGLTETSSS